MEYFLKVICALIFFHFEYVMHAVLCALTNFPFTVKLNSSNREDLGVSL